MKEGHAESHGEESLDPRRIDLARLVLAGPVPSAVDDDPEGKEVLAELIELYRSLPAAVQEDVALLSLPMENPEQNASMVNALQRASSVVVQNSIREGFGLTVTEAMWKHVPVLTNRQACGPRHQVRDSIDGCVIGDPENVEELAAGLDAMLASPGRREYRGRNAQRHVHERFLIFTPLREWLDLLSELIEALPSSYATASASISISISGWTRRRISTMVVAGGCAAAVPLTKPRSPAQSARQYPTWLSRQGAAVVTLERDHRPFLPRLGYGHFEAHRGMTPKLHPIIVKGV